MLTQNYNVLAHANIYYVLVLTLCYHMSEKSIQIGIRVSPAVNAALEKAGAEKGLSKSALVTMLVYEFVNEVEA